MIGRRLENLLELDYPPERLEIVVASDGSTDRTDAIVDEIAAENPRVRLLQCPREGKVAAQHRSVRETASDVLAFTDANTEWKPDALRKLVRNLADPEVGYVCGQLRLESPDGANMEGLYWRYEVWVREQESPASSITAGQRRDLRGAARGIRRGRPEVRARLRLPVPDGAGGAACGVRPRGGRGREAGERAGGRVRAEGAHDRTRLGHLLTGRIFRRTRPLYMAELVSHRVLRYSTVSSTSGCSSRTWRSVAARPSTGSFLVLQLAGSVWPPPDEHGSRSRERDLRTTTTS